MDTEGDDAIAALREALAERGLGTRGSFAELEERLVDAIASEQNEEPDIDVSSMSIKELKELISKARLSFDDCIDKSDLQMRATQAAAKLAATQEPRQSVSAQDKPDAHAKQQAAATRDHPTVNAMCREQIELLSLKEMRGLIMESGLSADGCTEKAELRERACEALARLMLPGAKCGPIARPLVAAAVERAATAAALAKDEARQAREAMKRQMQEEEAAAVEAATAARKAREREKRKAKKGRKKENKLLAQASARATKENGSGEEEDDDEEEQEDGEEEEEEVLLRLAAARLHVVPGTGGRDGVEEYGVADEPTWPAHTSEAAAPVDDKGGNAAGGDGQTALPPGWRIENGLLLEEGESAPVKKAKPKAKKQR